MANELDYTSYDFDSLIDQLINRLKEKDSWTDAYRSGTGQMLIELFAYIGNMVLYYLERRAEESYIETAQLKSSVINLVKLINYTPKRNVSASGYATFSIASPHTENIYIPQYTKLATSDGLKYVVSDDAVLLKGNTSVNVNVMQGEIKEVLNTADGSENQSYNVNDTLIENSHIYVYVDNILWTKTTTFLGATASSEIYTLNTELDETVTVNFGDGGKGKSPADGSEIKILYIESSGLSGNIYTSGKLTTISDNIFDENGVTVDLTVTNDEPIIGGDDAESIDEIKYEAPRVFSTGDRLVTKEDYIAYLENYAGVASVNAWGESEENPPNYDMFNRVKIAIIMQNWQFVTQSFIDTLSEAIRDKAQLTVKYQFLNPDIIYVIPKLDAKVNKNYGLSAAQNSIENAFDNLFILGDTTRIGVNKRISDIVCAIDSLPEIDYTHIILELYRELIQNYDSMYDYGYILNAIPVLEDSVNVYVGTELIATDDGAGTLVDQSTTYTVSGIINYSTGYIGVNISPTPSETVFVKYQQNENGDIVVNKQQILKLEDINITSLSH